MTAKRTHRTTGLASGHANSDAARIAGKKGKSKSPWGQSPMAGTEKAKRIFTERKFPLGIPRRSP